MPIDDCCDKIKTNGKDKNEVGYFAIAEKTVEMTTRLENGGVLHTTVHLCPDHILKAAKASCREIRQKEEERIKNSFPYRTLKFLGLYKR